MLKAIFIVLCILLLSACSADSVFLSLHTSNVINPDDQHRALSLYVKIFQLQSLQDFKDKSFDELFALKINQNVLVITTLLVQSNETRTLTIDLNDKTQFLAIVPDFRKPDSKKILIIPVRNNSFSTNQISILIQDNQLELGGVS